MVYFIFMLIGVLIGLIIGCVQTDSIQNNIETQEAFLSRNGYYSFVRLFSIRKSMGTLSYFKYKSMIHRKCEEIIKEKLAEIDYVEDGFTNKN